MTCEDVVSDFKDVVANTEVDHWKVLAYENAVSRTSLSEDEIKEFDDLYLTR